MNISAEKERHKNLKIYPKENMKDKIDRILFDNEHKNIIDKCIVEINVQWWARDKRKYITKTFKLTNNRRMEGVEYKYT